MDGQERTVRSAERFALSAKTAGKLEQPNDKLFAIASHVDDKFGAYLTYSSLAVVYAKRLYE